MEKEIMEERAVELVSRHLSTYPKMRIADAYKLLYQACMGPEHAIPDPLSVETWLLEEWESIEIGPEKESRADPEEDLYEELSLHHPIFRINLRAAKARNIEPSQILEEFVRLGHEFPKNRRVLENAWETVSRKIRAGNIALPDAGGLDEFDEMVREKGYPPMHHSREYAEAYKPSYRLVGSEV